MFGELSARLGETVLDLGGRRQRAVLAVLVLARGSVVSDDRLIDCLWGGEASATSVGTLQAYVSHLRKRLDPGRVAKGLIVRRGVGYVLPLDEDVVDAWRFERLLRLAGEVAPAQAVGLLSEALGLWRGPVLAEYASESWAQPEVARLDELRELAREQLMGARLEL